MEIERDYAWKYFELHASQRLTTFHYYIVIATIVATGLFSSFHKDFKVPVLGALSGLLLALLSFVFWKLDQRNRTLIKNAETALKHLEQENAPVTRLFLNDAEHFEPLKESASFFPWKNHYSYSQCFQLVFLGFGCFGLVGAITSLIQSGLLQIRFYALP